MLKLTRVSLAVLFMVLSGCATSTDFGAYQRAINEFSSATHATSAATLTYIVALNRFERDREFELLEEDVTRELNLPAILDERFSPEAIRARAQAFQVLAQYSVMLGRIASSDAPEQWRSAADRATASARGLIGTLGETGIAPGAAQHPLAQALGPLNQLVTAIGTGIINQRRATALNTAIQRAAPAVNMISTRLREDILLVTRQRDSVALLELSEATIEYSIARMAALEDLDNTARERERLQALRNVRDLLGTREEQAAELSRLGEALTAFDDAHAALVDYASSAQGDPDLSALVESISRYAIIARELAGVIASAT